MNRETSGVVVSDVVLIFTWLDFRNLEVFLVIECETKKLETETKPRECFDWPMITVATFAKDETNFIMDAFLWWLHLPSWKKDSTCFSDLNLYKNYFSIM